MGDLRGAQDTIGLALCVAGLALEVRIGLIEDGTKRWFIISVLVHQLLGSVQVVSLFAKVCTAWEERTSPPLKMEKPVLAMIFQVIADGQKRAFKKDPANSGKFIDVGLWSRCRHPNYVGEMVRSRGCIDLVFRLLVSARLTMPLGYYCCRSGFAALLRRVCLSDNTRCRLRLHPAVCSMASKVYREPSNTGFKPCPPPPTPPTSWSLPTTYQARSLVLDRGVPPLVSLCFGFRILDFG